MKKLLAPIFTSLLGIKSVDAQSGEPTSGLTGGSEVHEEKWFVNKDVFSKSIYLPLTMQKVAPVKIASDKLMGNIGLYKILSGEESDKENMASPKQFAVNKFDALANAHNMPVMTPSLIPEMPTLNPMDSTVHYFILKKMLKLKE